MYPPEFINKLTPSGVPPDILKLKQKRRITILRNLGAINGDCNGIHYITVSLHDHVIEDEIASGLYAGSILLIPRIFHVFQEMKFPFIFTRNVLSSQLLPWRTTRYRDRLLNKLKYIFRHNSSHMVSCILPHLEFEKTLM